MKPILLDVAIEPTNRCNLKCKICFARNSKRQIGDMSIENFIKIVEELEDIQTIKMVALNFAGEPLLHPNFSGMLRWVANNGWTVGFTTNGMLLTEEIARTIIETGVAKIDISLDAVGPRVEQMRKGINYRTVRKNIIRLREIKDELKGNTIIGISCAFSEDNILRDPLMVLANMYEIVDKIKVCPVRNENGTYQRPELFERAKVENMMCESPRYYMGILWNGDAVPCCADISAQHVMGNVLKEGVMGVFNNEKYNKLRKSNCENCEWWKESLGFAIGRNQIRKK
jgi:MoaA/NifB/PqqE/SkfB family radical SAM enzyme